MKKKIAPLHFTIKCELYPFDVVCSFGEEFEVVKKWLRKIGLPEQELQDVDYSTKNSPGYYVLFTSGMTMIRLREVPATPASWGVLHHEILHVVFAIMERIGMKYDPKISEEAFTYLNQYLVSQVYDKLF